MRNSGWRSTRGCFNISSCSAALFTRPLAAIPKRTEPNLMSGRTQPFVGIPSCLRSIYERPFHTVSERYTDAVIEAAGCLPLLIPAIGPKTDCGALLDGLDGLLITGSPSNVEPHHYGGPPSMEGTLHDPDRDATTLPLIREAVRRDMPDRKSVVE